ncbi:hypothetical protein [Gottfriedia solisilvae]|uniref:hypothetical protein n=1 Tax=Gottfriedia solisilvae TaxID=1516104 RepID=UPI003D2F39CC
MRLSLVYITFLLALLVGCSQETSYKSLATHSNFPIPENAKLTVGKAKNPNIEKYAKYKRKEADEIESIPAGYLKVIKSKGWVEHGEEQLGANNSRWFLYLVKNEKRC